MEDSEFKIIEEYNVYNSKWLSVSELITLTDGYSQGTYNVVNKNNCVSAVIENLENKILFVKSFRFPTREYAWELPMGGIEKNETSDYAVKREVFEEVGIKPDLYVLQKFHPNPGLTSQSAIVYYGRIGKKETRMALDYNVKVDEIVDRKFFNHLEWKKLIQNGLITDGLTMSSLMIYEILHNIVERRK